MLHHGLSETILVNTLTDVRELKKLNNFTQPHLYCLNVQLSPPPFLVPNECQILFIMYFVIAPNVNKMRIHTDQLGDQLMMSKGSMHVCCLLWRADHNKLISNPCLQGKQWISLKIVPDTFIIIFAM